jgi:esterase/lipase superfamily enzyme
MIDDTNLLLLAVADVQSKLQDVVGDAWPDFSKRLEVLLDKLATGNPTARREILDLFSQHPAAYQNLVAGIERLGVRLMQFRKAEATLPSASMDAFVRVPVLYATDREHASHGLSDPYYSGERALMRYGAAEISIPFDHRIGEIERPVWWKLEFRENPARHVAILNIAEIDEEVFLGRIGMPAEPEVLMFIHGYNVTFPDALRRTAQMAVDLRFSGPSILFSWPSQGRTHKYLVDETNAQWAVDDLERLALNIITQSKARSIHLIAHSMGGRILAQVLERISRLNLPPEATRLRQIIFAAPDIDAETFKKAASQFYDRGERCTLYASSNDEALAISKTLHGYTRAGDAGEHIIVMQGLDTLDASAMDTSLVGHSYYGSKRSILSDVHDLLRYGHGPNGRFGLLPCTHPAGSYWMFQA